MRVKLMPDSIVKVGEGTARIGDGRVALAVEEADRELRIDGRLAGIGRWAR